VGVGIVLASQGRFAEAKRFLEQALRLDPLNETARKVLRRVDARP
jgi:tetratricopeptide (TPR) repeat protein